MMSFISPNANEGNRFSDDLPDYLNDLNALAAARNQLIATPELRIKWVNTLRDVVGQTCARRNKAGQPLVSDIDLLFANATQHAEALGVALGLWKLS